MSIRKHTAAILFGLSLCLTAAACGGDDASCEKVVDHTLSLLPAEMKGQMGDKKPMIQRCEKESTPEQRKCVLGAKSMEDVVKCPKK